MKKISLFLILTLVSISIISCASKKNARVMRMEGGVNKAEFIDANEQTSKDVVLQGANEFCEKENRKAVVVSEKTTFSGTFDEKTTNAIKKVGTIGQVLGNNDVSSTSNAAIDDARYTTTLMFKCE